MKSNVKTSLYFSAYPLKAIKALTPSSAPESPYLRSVLAGKIKVSSKVRVFPMVNPYPKPKTSTGPISPIKDIGISGEEWFCNYE
jgi:hypothetical protein